MRISIYTEKGRNFSGRGDWGNRRYKVDVHAIGKDIYVWFNDYQNRTLGSFNLTRDAAKRLATGILSVSDSVAKKDSFTYDESPVMESQPLIGVTVADLGKGLIKYIENDERHPDADASLFLDEILQANDLCVVPRKEADHGTLDG